MDASLERTIWWSRADPARVGVGGMGSISDVVLYREGHLLTTENNALHQLLPALYDDCKNARST